MDQPNIQASVPAAPASKSKVLVSVGIVIVLLAGVGIAAAFVFNMKPITPQQAFIKVVSSYKDVTSFAFTSEVSGTAATMAKTGAPFNAGTFNFTTDGKMNIKDPKNPQADVNVGLEFHAANTIAKADAAARVDMIVLAKKGFAKINDLTLSYVPAKPDAMTTAVPGYAQTAIDAAKGKWVSFDLNAQNKSIVKDTEASKKLEKKIMAFDYFDNIQTLPDETVQGVETHHYQATLNLQKFKSISDSIKSQQTSFLGGPMLAAVADRVSESTSTDPTFGIWIGKNDWHVYRIAVLESTFKDGKSGSMLTSKGQIEFSHYNEPVTVVAPAGAITAEEFQQQITQSFMPQQGLK